MLFQLQIPKRNTLCAQQGERFSAGMEVYSLLLEEEKQKPVRKDFCSVCWSQARQTDALKGNLSYWKSKIEAKKESPESTRTEKALSLLQTLVQNEPSDQTLAEAFVLCLFLAHAKQLFLRREWQKEGGTYQLYENKQEEFFTVQVLHLSSEQINHLQQSLAQKLH